MRRNILNMIKENNEAGLQANIFQQKDDKFISEMESCIAELRVYKKESKMIRDTESLIVDSPRGLEILSRLEEILTSRFIVDSKASFKIMAGSNFDAFSFPVTPETARSFIKANDDKKTTDELVEVLKQLKQSSSSYFIDEEDVVFSLDNIDGYKKLVEKLISDSRALDKALRNGEVVFDLKNAKIGKLPDDFNSIIGIDFYNLLDVLSDREIVSIMLHEVGHCYTILLDLYRKANVSLSISNLVSDVGYNTKDKKSIEKISLTMKSEFNVESPLIDKNIKDREIISYVSNIFDSVISNKSKERDNSYAEKIADQFASKFGLEVELISALQKISKHESINPESSNITAWDLTAYLDKLTLIALIISVVVFIVGVLTSSLSLLLTSLAISFITKIVDICLSVAIHILYGLYRVTSMLLGLAKKKINNRYVEDKRRFELIRNDFIRRLNGLSPKTKEERLILKSKLEDLRDIDNGIGEMKSDKTLIGLIGQTFVPDFILDKIGATPLKVSREVLINEMLEDMEANRLKVLSEKIKLSGGL